MFEEYLRGDFGIAYNSLIGSLLNAELTIRNNTHVIRSVNVNETATYI